MFFVASLILVPSIFLFFFFNDTATTEIYTLSLHDALPISESLSRRSAQNPGEPLDGGYAGLDMAYRRAGAATCGRSEKHTSELPSPQHLPFPLFLLKKKNINHTYPI